MGDAYVRISDRGAPLTEKVKARVTVDDATGCWNWLLSKTKEGYGIFSIRSRVMGAHRVSYKAFVGDIPAGMHVDHLCRNRACVNPDHLEAVTPRENLLRSDVPSARAVRENKCVAGHDLIGRNVAIVQGYRRCMECCRIRSRLRVQRARRAVAA